MRSTSRPCRSCGRQIILLRSTSTGKWMPVDTDSVETGNIRVDQYRTTAEVLTGDPLQSARDAGEGLHEAHFKTCPHADRHRKRQTTPDTPALFDPEEDPL